MYTSTRYLLLRLERCVSCEGRLSTNISQSRQADDIAQTTKQYEHQSVQTSRRHCSNKQNSTNISQNVGADDVVQANKTVRRIPVTGFWSHRPEETLCGRQDVQILNLTYWRSPLFLQAATVAPLMGPSSLSARRCTSALPPPAGVRTRGS